MHEKVTLRRSAVAVMAAVFLAALPALSLAAEWQWIAPQRVNALLKEGSGLWLVDVRNEGAFKEGHLEGAMLIPADTIASKRLPKGKVVVLVDDSLGLRKGRGAAETLLKNGHEKVFVLDGGLPTWEGEGYPVTGKGALFKSVMPEDIAWASENKIPLRVLDLRDLAEQSQGPVKMARNVEGKNFAERLVKVKELLDPGKKGLTAKLEKPVPTVLVLPTAVDPRPVLERALRGSAGDVRYLAGAYAAWAAKPDKNLIGARGACPTCPAAAPGGTK